MAGGQRFAELGEFIKPNPAGFATRDFIARTAGLMDSQLDWVKKRINKKNRTVAAANIGTAAFPEGVNFCARALTPAGPNPFPDSLFL